MQNLAQKQRAIPKSALRILTRDLNTSFVILQSGAEPDSPEAQALVKKLQGYITDHYYTCTDEILAGLGQMYVADERFKENIDKYADGTAEFVSEVIKMYTKRQRSRK